MSVGVIPCFTLEAQHPAAPGSSELKNAVPKPRIRSHACQALSMRSHSWPEPDLKKRKGKWRSARRNVVPRKSLKILLCYCIWWYLVVTLCLIGFTMFHTAWGKRGPSRRTNWTLRVLEPMSQLAEQDWLDCFHSQQIAMSVTPSYVFWWVTCNLQTILEKLTKRPARAYSEHIFPHTFLYTRQSAHF